MTQNSQLLALLRARQGVGVTALEALNLIGSLRLAARVNDLRAMGHDIESTMVTLDSGKRVARYVLIPHRPTEPAPTLWDGWTEAEARLATGDR